MEEPNASFVSRLFEKVGAALELASTSEDENEQAYWLGMADCSIELIAEETNESYVTIKADVEVQYDFLSLADRINEAFRDKEI